VRPGRGKLFAAPWQSLTLEADSKCFIPDIEQKRLKNAPGFDREDWPSMADEQWAASVTRSLGRNLAMAREIPLFERRSP
jgi:hypothetical protein